MAIGIQLNLLRDISPHFLRRKATPEPRPAYWHVLGSTDYLFWAELKSFPAIGALPEVDLAEQNPGGKIELNLVPNPLLPLSGFHQQIESDLLFLKAPSSKSLFIVKMTVSAVALDQNDTFEEVLAEITRIERAVSNICKFDDASLYWSLGGTDLVMLVRTDLDREAKQLMSTVRKIRRLMNSDVEAMNLRSNLHHIFSSVVGVLASKPDEIVSNSEQAEEGYVFRTRTSVAAGHEGRSASIQAGFESWGERSLHHDSATMHDFNKLRSQMFWRTQPKTQRMTDVDSSRTEILFPVSADDYVDDVPHGEISLSAQAEVLLAGVEKNLSQFSRELLGKTQGAEIGKVFNTLRHAMLRTERVGAIRDMLPFFRQLSKCVASEHWTNYLQQPSAIEDTSASLTMLCNHLWRSIRNRIESRVENLDPSFPGSLDNGASKLVNAYSVVAWICWEVFARNPNGEYHEMVVSKDNVACRAESFAACICSGSAGRVECQEAFAYFRDHLENALGYKLNDRNDREWNSRLLLLNISGPILYRPEAAVAHCLHEMAEFAAWTTNPWNVVLATGLTEHAIKVVKGMLLAVLENSGNIPIFQSDEMRSSFGTELESLLRASVLCLINPEGHDNLNEAETLFAKERLVDFPGRLVESLQRLAGRQFAGRVFRLLPGNIENFTQLRMNLDSALRDRPIAGEKQSQAVFLASEFNEYVDLLGDLLNECASDLGMALGLRQIIQMPKLGGSNTDDEITTADVNYCFGCMLESLHSWLRGGTTAKTAMCKLIARWSVLHRAVSEIRPVEQWKREFENDVASYYRLLVEATTMTDQEIREVVSETMSKYEDFLLVDPDGPGENDDVISLSGFVRRTLRSSKGQELNIAMLQPAQKALLLNVRSAWQLACKEALENTKTANQSEEVNPESESLGQARSVLIFSLWAKSQKLAERSLLVVG